MLSKTKAKYIQSLEQKKFRDEYMQFIAEGPKLIADLADSQKFKFSILCATASWLDENQNTLAKANVEEVITVNEQELQKISQLKTPHSVLAVLNKSKELSPQIEGKLSLLLDDIRDPGNLGTIVRIADWFKAENIICSPGCVDVYNSKVIQATMGSIARVNILYRDPVKFLKENSNIESFATTLGGQSIHKMDRIKQGIIIVGNEGKGIDQELIGMANYKITIPKFGGAESLNAAVATGIILSHLVLH